MRVTTDDGKYTVVVEDGRFYALRDGEMWRECMGDTLILMLVYDLENARRQLAALQAANAAGDLGDSR